VLKGLGLLLIAVVSGMLWWLIQQGSGAPASNDTKSTGTQKPVGKYTFAKATELSGPVRDSNCVEHSYRKVQTYFKGKNCTSLIRGLYTVAKDGKTAYASVSVVQMPSAQDAQDLKTLTEQDDTGNVADLVRDKKAKVGSLQNLSSGGFAAKVESSTVIIVEADYESSSKPAEKSTLDDICNDALRLGDELRQG
jgi:hypothetical protein